jgi:4-hydroxymandelate oxidase
VRLGRIERRLFTGASPSAADPALRSYLTDLVAPYGRPLREEPFRVAAGHSYGEMGESIVCALAAGGEPVDLIIVSHAMPDVVPGRATACHLSHVCPGRPTAFAVCDQGTAAAFTAVALAQSYVETGQYRRPLVLVLEQAVLHYEAPVGVPLPARPSAVGLVLGDAAGPVVRDPVQRADVGPERVAEVLAAELAEVSTPDGVLILGRGVPGRPPDFPGEVRAAPSGQPATGPWWELADGLAGWAVAGRRIVLVDYDPALGYLCLLVVDP